MPTVLLLLLAPFAGSFLGLLVRRLPEGEPVVLARSRCEHCRSTLHAFDLIPIISFLALGGRCRRCGARIPRDHLEIELACLAIAAIEVCLEPDPRRAFAGAILGWILLALAWIDLRSFRLPDALTQSLLLVGLGVTVMLDPDALPSHAIAAGFAFSAFRAIGLSYRMMRGREGLGRGDAWLLAAGGAWTGWQPLPVIVLFAALLGLALAAVRSVRGQPVRGTTPLPFGPPLALAIWTSWSFCLGWPG